MCIRDRYNAYDNKAYLISTMMPDITHEVGTAAVSYTHLDVYKRQAIY